MRYCESHCYNLCICVRIICVVSQLPRLGQPSYAPASLCGMVILRLHARKQRRAVLSGAQKGICISLYQKKVWKFNSSCASQGVRARRCVCVCVFSHARPHLAHITYFCCLRLMRKTANRQLFASAEEHVLCMCALHSCVNINDCFFFCLYPGQKCAAQCCSEHQIYS